MTRKRSHLIRRVLIVAIAVGALMTALLGLRGYRSLVLLQSAYQAGEPRVADIRPWMTIGYVASAHQVSTAALADRLGLPPETDAETAVLRTLAEQEGISRFEYLRAVQRAVVDVRLGPMAADDRAPVGRLEAIGEDLLGAILVHGYVVLGLVLLLGAIGLPVPTGLSTVVAGSLTTHGDMTWAATAAVAVTASVLGDVIGYALGEMLSRAFLDRRGRWLGYTPTRRAHIQRLVDRWGGATVFLSRTLVSHLSSGVNLLMGASRYRLSRFIALTVAGRLIWTSAYLGLGYTIGTDLEAASSFLRDASLFLLSGGILVALVFVLLEEKGATGQA